MFEAQGGCALLLSHPGIFASRVLWGAAIDGTARELLAQADANDNPEEQGALADAKKELGIEAFKVDMKEGWKWKMGTKGATKREEAQQNSVDPFEEVGTLRGGKAPKSEPLTAGISNDEEAPSATYNDAEVFE